MEQKTREINGTTYKVTTMDAFVAISVKAKLIKLFGSSLGELTGGANKESIKQAITILSSNMDDDNIVSIIRKLFEKNVFYVQVVGTQSIDKPVEFGSHFSGKTLEMWQVALFILEVNFSDVLGKLGLNSLFQEASQSLES